MNYQNYQYPNGFNGASNGMPQPFNMNGNPYMNRWGQLSPQFYQQEIAFQEEWMRQQKEYFRKIIKERYPVKFAIASSTILIIICLIEIAMQIIIIVNKAPLYYVGGGIWAGLFGIGLGLLVLATGKFLFETACIYF
jgi:hypothetical protein